MSSANLLPLPVLLPLLGAALTLVARRHRRTQVAISLGVLAASLAVAVTLMYRTHEEGPIALWLGAWSEPLGIALVADRLSALMLLVSSFVILVVLVFAIGQGVADGDDDSPSRSTSPPISCCRPASPMPSSPVISSTSSSASRCCSSRASSC